MVPPKAKILIPLALSVVIFFSNAMNMQDGMQKPKEIMTKLRKGLSVAKSTVGDYAGKMCMPVCSSPT